MEEGEHVPAWKRLGLKVQEASNDVDVGNEKSLASQKRKRDEQKPTSTAEKKPPKRKKVPKSERQPPPEADQLAYLRQFHQDRANWKFSKQKQNWVLKHLYDIPEDKYGEALIAYIQGLQGASRDRVAAEARELINKWNEFMSRTDEQEEGEEQMEEEKEKDEKEKETEKETEKEDEKKEKENDQKKEKEKESETKPPEEFQAKRAQAIVSALLGEKIKLVLIDEGDVETSAGKSEETQLEGTYDGTGGEQYDSEEVVKENDKNKEKKEEKKKQKEEKKKEKEEKKKQKEEKKKEKEEKKKEKEEKMKEKNEKKERKEKKKQDD